MPRGSILGSFLDHFSGRSAKTKKCVWTAQACADCISSLPEKWLFRSFLVSFLRVLWGRHLEHDFFGFRAILGSLGMTIWLQKVIKKWDPKKGSKKGTRVAQVTGCGRLKNRQTESHIRHQTTRRWPEHALACLAARWRIYIYIYIYYR